MRIRSLNVELLLRASERLLFDSTPARALLRRHRLRLIEDALERGLPIELERPLRWLAIGELEDADEHRSDAVERIRADLAARTDATALSPGGRRVPVRRLALAASVDRRWGVFLYLLAKAVEARTAVELGSCVGIGTAYIASADSVRVVSIEASAERAAIARRTVAGVSDRAAVVEGYFDDALPDVLEGLGDRVDLAWIDGHHSKRATLRYFEAIRPRLREGAVVAFDDISARWLPELREGWRILQRADGFADTLDLGPIGIGIWAGEGSAPRAHDLRGVCGPPRWLHRLREPG